MSNKSTSSLFTHLHFQGNKYIYHFLGDGIGDKKKQKEILGDLSYSLAGGKDFQKVLDIQITGIN